VKVKKEKRQVVRALQRECDGGSWGYVGNFTRRCNNGGEFASEKGCKCRKKKFLHQYSMEYVSGHCLRYHQIEE
jgi:hypothetical protein